LLINKHGVVSNINVALSLHWSISILFYVLTFCQLLPVLPVFSTVLAKILFAMAKTQPWISFACVNSATLFSAKVNHFIKCDFYTNTPLKRPKQETIRIFVINCMPCCNFTVNIGLLAAHEDHNTVKLQSRFSPIRL